MSGALRGRFAQGLPISSEVGQREHGPAHLFDKVAVRIESYLYPMKVLLFMTVAQAGSALAAENSCSLASNTRQVYTY